MPEHSGSDRPGGRTARTREAVHNAVRELLGEPGAELSIPAVAARSGVHATTIYRRWHTIESIVLDVAVDRLAEQYPVPATGDLRADLTEYVHRLLTELQRAASPTFLRALLAAAYQADQATEIIDLLAPRLRQFQTMLDAAGVTRIDGMRLFELVLAPAYIRTQLGLPIDPDEGTARLVETVLALAYEPDARRDVD